MYDSQDANGFVSNGYAANAAATNGESVAASPAPYPTNGYNGSEYSGYHDNGSIISTDGNGSTANSSGEHGNGYTGSENGGVQFVRRRLLPSIPKGEELRLKPLYLQSIIQEVPHPPALFSRP